CPNSCRSGSSLAHITIQWSRFACFYNARIKYTAALTTLLEILQEILPIIIILPNFTVWEARLEGILNIAEVLGFHRILKIARTCFEWCDGEPVHDVLHVVLEMVSLDMFICQSLK
ncbi:MAG: hypothetical protein RLY65_907, partial [Pseudomonadota bacterium]